MPLLPPGIPRSEVHSVWEWFGSWAEIQAIAVISSCIPACGRRWLNGNIPATNLSGSAFMSTTRGRRGGRIRFSQGLPC